MNTIKRRFSHRLSGNFDIFFGKKIIRQLVLIFISFILLNLNAKAQKTIDTAAIVNSIFPRGEKVASGNNFNGVVWLNRFISPGDSLDCIVALPGYGTTGSKGK